MRWHGVLPEGAIAGFDHLEASVLQHAARGRAHQRLVVGEQHDATQLHPGALRALKVDAEVALFVLRLDSLEAELDQGGFFDPKAFDDAKTNFFAAARQE